MSGDKAIAALDNLLWCALQTEHSHLAMTAVNACKYPADVAPFAALRENTAESLLQLLSLLEPGETTYVAGERPPMTNGEAYPALQMIAGSCYGESTDESADRLTAEDADAMVALTGIAFPGFFRRRTCEMGAYYGIREKGELVAMVGERLAVSGYREISGVCTHPDHTGKGYGAKLIKLLMAEHAKTGLTSFLHVAPDNKRAIALYERLGFVVRTEIQLHPVSGAGV